MVALEAQRVLLRPSEAIVLQLGTLLAEAGGILKPGVEVSALRS